MTVLLLQCMYNLHLVTESTMRTK